MKEVGVKIIENVLYREWNYLGIKTWNSLRDNLNYKTYIKLLMTLNPYRSSGNWELRARMMISDTIRDELKSITKVD